MGANQRGLALGATNQKDVAIVAQQRACLNHQAFEVEILNLNLVLQLMTDQLKSTMDMVKMYQELGDATELAKSMNLVKDRMNKIGQMCKTLANLKAGNILDRLVDLYLSKRGSVIYNWCQCFKQKNIRAINVVLTIKQKCVMI